MIRTLRIAFENKKWEWVQVWKFALNVTVCYLLGYSLAKSLVMRLLERQPVRVQENVAMLAVFTQTVWGQAMTTFLSPCSRSWNCAVGCRMGLRWA